VVVVDRVGLKSKALGSACESSCVFVIAIELEMQIPEPLTAPSKILLAIRRHFVHVSNSPQSRL
jgi:hypothetical protein